MAPIHSATTEDHIEAVQFLIDNGADINATADGHTPLEMIYCNLATMIGENDAAMNMAMFLLTNGEYN